MAWKRLGRLTRSADVPVPADASAGGPDIGGADDAGSSTLKRTKPADGPAKRSAAAKTVEKAGSSGEAEAAGRAESSDESAPTAKAKATDKAKAKSKAKKRAVAATDVPAEDVERLVDEGMMIVRSALRMSAKNRLIVQVLGTGETFDEDALVDAVRLDVRSLAEEKSQEAERLEVVATKASKKPGRAAFHDDYRRQDVRALTLREQVGRETARRLHDLSEDLEVLRELIRSARESALDDVIQARLSAVMPYRRDPDYRRERPERMRALADDLSILRRRQKARLGDRVP